MRRSVSDPEEIPRSLTAQSRGKPLPPSTSLSRVFYIRRNVTIRSTRVSRQKRRLCVKHWNQTMWFWPLGRHHTDPVKCDEAVKEECSIIFCYSSNSVCSATLSYTPRTHLDWEQKNETNELSGEFPRVT
ncbi:hypothetical protein F2P81_017891 [Scophthalmus maximus]|uniref:Uncharacterized protein n=1 Tax=Scophthalmus maximus TaxID=52904 RepID=A0A6A4S0Q0_SCOMX|nr:hypothetical protein F2P81_017891 [Scophthalmus maximus]